MSTLRLRSVCPQLALKLGELEVGTALLDRDARCGSAVIYELGFPLPPRARRAFSWRRAMLSSFNMGSAALRAAAKLYGRGARVAASPRVANALRTVWVWLVAGLTGLSVGCAMVAALTIAILLVAPPD